jgi:hypothetical protein
LDGRLLLLLATDPEKEPRLQMGHDFETQEGIMFGIDVEGWWAGEPIMMGPDTMGCPIPRLGDLPPDEYHVQALLHRYETFHRSDGHIVKLPMDRGEGQKWHLAPGNLYSAPRTLTLDPAQGEVHKIVLDQVIEDFEEREDTAYIKHVRIQSERLTAFWGRPMHLEAILLLPEGYDEHPEARYPLMIYHGHHHREFYTPVGFRDTPPDAEAEALEDYDLTYEEYSYQFYKDWTAKNVGAIPISRDEVDCTDWAGVGFPRVIIVTIQHANPYYDDSYAVNSANLGPYGDAITYELIPYIEAHYRAIGEPWARTLYGGSTGGWEALAAQIFYPDEYNGAWANCPDPIDFRAYTVVNIYEHENAYHVDHPWKRTPRPGKRNYLGEVLATLEEENHRELVLGTHGRSGGQWDIWQAVYSPVAPYSSCSPKVSDRGGRGTSVGDLVQQEKPRDLVQQEKPGDLVQQEKPGDLVQQQQSNRGAGYPAPIWDKRTGAIDPEVATYWREHYDLRYILEREWATLGPKLQGKLHIYVGDMDNYYLNNAVYLMEEFLENTDDPPYGGEIQYGDRFEHCWSGDPDTPNKISRLTYNQRFIPRMVDHILKTAPEGADVTSWRY